MRAGRFRAIPWLLLWHGLASAEPAADQSGAAPTRVQADELIAQGVELRKAADDRAALAVFRRAYELDASARGLAQMALAEQALGRWAEAYEHLETALGSDDAWVIERRVALAAALAEIDHQLGSLEVACNVPGASVEVDGRLLGRLPFSKPARIATGQSVITVAAPGHFSVVRRVQVDAGRLSRVDVVLTASTSALPKPTSPPSQPVEKASTSRDWLMYGSVGLASLGVTAGVTGVVLREVNVNVYNDDSRCRKDPSVPRSRTCPDEAAAWKRGELIAIVGFSTAAVFGGLGLYLWLDRPTANARASAACFAGFVNVACSGSF